MHLGGFTLGGKHRDETVGEIEQFKKLYGLTLTAADSHNLKERGE